MTPTNSTEGLEVGLDQVLNVVLDVVLGFPKWVDLAVGCGLDKARKEVDETAALLLLWSFCRPSRARQMERVCGVGFTGCCGRGQRELGL